MSNRSKGPSAHAPQILRTAASSQQSRASLCTFTFSDGRRCRTPRCSRHPHLCFFHARREAQARAAEDFGRNVAECFSREYISACELSVALSRLFTAAAQGHFKPKAAASLAYLGQVMLQSIQLAGHEYSEAFGGNAWRRIVRSAFLDDSPAPTQPAPKTLAPQPPAPVPSATPTQPAPPEPPTASCSGGFTPPLSLGSAPSFSPSVPAAPSPKPPSPEQTQPVAPESSLTSSAFALSSESKGVVAPFPVEVGLQPGSSSATTVAAQSAAPQRSPAETRTPRAKSPASPAKAATSPLPHPNFNKPANWDALIPPKPLPKRNRHGLFRPYHWPE